MISIRALVTRDMAHWEGNMADWDKRDWAHGIEIGALLVANRLANTKINEAR